MVKDQPSTTQEELVNDLKAVGNTCYELETTQRGTEENPEGWNVPQERPKQPSRDKEEIQISPWAI